MGRSRRQVYCWHCRSARCCNRPKNEAEQEQARREQARYEQEQAALHAEISRAVPGLEKLLRERGEAAQRLLAAASASLGFEKSIRFGRHYQGGGSATAVVFTKDGLLYVIGSGQSSYSQGTERARPATAYEAIEHAVKHGGKRASEVTAWFKNQLDELAKRAQ